MAEEEQGSVVTAVEAYQALVNLAEETRKAHESTAAFGGMASIFGGSGPS